MWVSSTGPYHFSREDSSNFLFEGKCGGGDGGISR